MREALHVIDNELVHLPYSATDDDVSNFKKLAKKEIYQCPYCQAKLIVKHGSERGLYFSHQHSEACEESRMVDNAEKRYTKQVERESSLHKVLLDIIMDELEVKARINHGMFVNVGYKEKADWKEYPDIYVKLPNKEIAVCIVTNVSPAHDSKLAQQITKRHEYFIEQGLEPVWFIEKKEQAIEKDKNSIILWDAELTIASKTYEDKMWDKVITKEIDDEKLFEYFNYPNTINKKVDVNSLYYIFNNNQQVVVKVQRFLKDRVVKPLRAFLISDGYELPFAEALAIDDGFRLSNPNIEEELRKAFQDKLIQEREEHVEQQLHEENLRKLKIEQDEKERELRLKELRQQRMGEEIIPEITYNELKQLLKERIGLTQKEQMQLWNRYMPRIGYNSSVIWNIVISNECKSFSDLKRYLEK